MDRRNGILSMVALTSFLFCGMTAPQGCTNNNGHGTAIAVAVVATVGVGAAVIIAVHSSHHNIKGCAYSDAAGLHVQDGEKNFVLSGATPNVKVGDVVKLHGSKVKQTKGDTGDQTFVVEKVSKDYGVCKAQPNAAVPAS